MKRKKSAPPFRPAIDAENIQKFLETALAHHQAERLNEAQLLYERILAIDPNHPDALNLSGLIALSRGDSSRALELVGKAVQLQPNVSFFLGNFGLALRANGRIDEAIDYYRRAIAADPNNAVPITNLGAVYDEMDQLEEAMAQYERALTIRPDHFEALFNLGLTARALCQFDRSIQFLRKAVAASPTRAEAHYTLGQTLLLLGELEAAWPEYDWRWKLDEYSWLKNCHGEFSQPRWLGEPLEGKRLLVYAEQGMGDALHFVRYLPRLVEMGAQVIFAVHRRLMRVIGSIPGVTIVPLDGVPLPPFDLHSPLLSLPRALGIRRIAEITAATPYLAAEPERVARWKQRLASIPGFKVGIAWQGNPAARIDRGRSLPLAAFAPLATVPGVTLVSLQQKDGLEQLKALPSGMKVEQLGDGIDTDGAFVDTAAIMENLDLIVVSDSAVAHLAGALGRPVWVPLKQVPDWRFFLDREDSPWYPSMRLFRQKRRGDWEGVFQEMAKSLKSHIDGNPLPSMASQAKPQEKEMPLIPQSWGEIIDKITILEIKSGKLTDPAKLMNIQKELRELVTARERYFPEHRGLAQLSEKLKKVNEALWLIEDEIRDCERNKDFSAKFIELARAVYVTNDQRAVVKREINDLLGSALVEEKSYAAYVDDPQSLMQAMTRSLKKPSEKPSALDRYSRLDAFIAKCLKRDVYPEPPSQLHSALTKLQLAKMDEKMSLRGKRVLDVGCGQGVALEMLREYGAIPTGLTFGEDFEVCRKKGLDVLEMDMSFLDFPPESFDLIWARHALEHSLFPLFTLDGFFSVLKKRGMLYVEVPASDTSARHQDNKNHYSCLTASSWVSLFQRSGFLLEDSFQINLQLTCGPDIYYVFFLRRT